MDFSVSILDSYTDRADPIADGNIGVIQTMVGELVKKPEHERE